LIIAQKITEKHEAVADAKFCGYKSIS